MVKRLFKKSIAIIMAVLMVVTTLPLSALAAESTFETVERTLTIEQFKTGLITNGNQVSQRMNGSRYEVCNDNGDGNFSVAYWQYETQALKELGVEQLKNASFTLTIPAAPLAKSTGLSVYYVDNTNADSFTGGDTRYTSLFGGNGQTNQTNTKNTFNLIHLQDIAVSSLVAGAKINIDIAAAFNNAINTAKNYSRVTIMVMQTGVSTNSSDKNGYSDTYVDYSTAIKVTAAYDETVEIFPGLDGINAGINTFESKMKSSSTSNIYKNMLPAYQAYLKAIRYRDAYMYGGQDAPTIEELDTVAQALQSANANMTVWTDEVTGKFTGVTPSFNDCGTSRNVTQGTDFKYYNNIIYTEDCRTSNYEDKDDKNGTNWSGMAIGYPLAGDVYMEIYYPNTILLWDGTQSIMPVMFMAKKTKNENRYITNVYPAQQLDASDTSWQTTKVGNDSYFVCTSVINGSNAQTWRGNGDTVSLNFDNCRKNGTAGVGAEVNNNFSQSSSNLSTNWSGRLKYWNAYAASFQLRDLDNYFNSASQKGYKQVGNYWAWYGVSDTNPQYLGGNFVDKNMKGYSQSVENSKHGVKKIYAFNYKGLADAIKNPDKAKLLADVKNYQQGGLSTLIAAYDAATSWANTANVSAINFDNIATQANNVTKMMNDINKGTATIDTGYSSYTGLKAAIDASKKYYAIDNTDYTKYTKEVWDPFVTAYQNAANYFYALYDGQPNDISIKSNLVFANAEPLIEPLTLAKDDLKNGMIRSVVNTQTLEYAIDNAMALVNNPQYFVDGTVDTGLAALVSQIKIAIWTSEDSYGYDTEKIDLTTENQAKVDGYVEQLCTKIAAAQFNVNYVLPNNYSMTTAIAKAQTYEKDAEKYGNYNTLQNAVADANTFQTQLGTFNGRVEGQIANTISSYADLVTRIVAAFTGLQPAFKLISNGTFASQGKTVKSEYASATRPNNFKFYWEYSTDQIIFITNHEAFSYELPISRWGSYNAQTGDDFDTVFDSIILDASNLPNGELNLQGAWNAGHGWLSGTGMTATQLEEYKAKTRISAGLELLIDSVKVTKSTGKAVGIDSSGANITDINHDFITELAITDGHDTQAWGGIYAKNGWTEFTTRTLVNVPAQTGAADMDNKPSAISNQLLLGKAGAYFGNVYFWRYAETLFDGWAGYGFERSPLLLNVQFVNVSTLFDLIAECSADSFVATKSQYTTTSWNALQNAITDANSNMDYANMTYDAIITECDRRYTNLYNARRTLKKCASNAALKKALSDYRTIYESHESDYKPESWTPFTTAYENAAAKFNADYSDLNITDVAASDQSKIDAVVTALTDAYKALIKKISFTDLDNAYRALLNIPDNVYTAESVEILNNTINAECSYVFLKDYQKAELYEDNTEALNGVKAETEALKGYMNLLVSYDDIENLDDSTLQAEKERLKASKDPDAYDPDQIATALAAVEETVNVKLQNVNVVCKRFASQEAIDDAVTKALSTVGLKQYTLTVKSDNNDSTGYVVNGQPLDVNGSVTLDYGTPITITREDGSSVDWYHEYTSTNTSLAKKFYSTTEELQFILRGNTILTTKSGTSTNNLKVSYVNSVNGSNVAVDYVPSGTQITLDASTAPKLPYYTFDSFKVNGVAKVSGDVITVTENTRITYVYTFTDDNKYTVYVTDLGYGWIPSNFTIENLKYNDEVSFVPGTPGAETPDGYAGTTLAYNLKQYVDGEAVASTVTVGDGRYQEGYNDYNAPPVYAWVKVNADSLPDWYAAMNDEAHGTLLYGTTIDGSDRGFKEGAADIIKGEVVMYGPEYTFRVHEDIGLIALDEFTFKKAVAEGIVDDNKSDNVDKVNIFTRSQLVVAPGQKVSIISNFALPENCTMVEKGVLASVSTTGEIAAGKDDFQLGNVGKNGVSKLKSNYKTAGNQFVISINTPSVAGRVIDTNVWFKWRAYITYRDAKGNLKTAYSPVTTPSNVADNVATTL